MTEYYSNLLGMDVRNLRIDAVFSNKDIDEILKAIFKGEKGISKEVFKKTYSKLSEGIETGYGQSVNTATDASLVYQLKNNVAVFSAFKANHYGEKMRQLLVDENGQQRSWAAFQKEAKKVDPLYNQTWLAAEFNLATRQARSAKQWQQFVRDQDVYPNLEYMPSRAADPRDDHKKYYGLVFPITHAFWDAFTPPNGWGCKCWLQQTRAEASDGIDDMDIPEPIPGIEPNAGKTGRVFSANGPYMTVGAAVNKELLKKQFKEYYSEIESFIVLKIPRSKNAVFLSNHAHGDDYLKNIYSLMLYSKKYKKDMQVNAHVKGVKNPELSDMKIRGDRAEWVDAIDARKFVKRNIKNKLKPKGQLAGEKSCFVLLDFNNKLTTEMMPGVAGQLKGIFKSRPALAYVILENNGKTFHLDSFSTLDELRVVIAKMRKEL